MTASSNGPGTDGSDRVVARALVVAPDGNHLGIQDKLAARGYHCTLATSIPESDTSPEGEHPDVVILIGDAADQIKLGSGPQAPIMVIGGEPNAALNVGHLRVVVVDALPLVFNDLELFSRVDSLVRLNTIREELDRRFETMGKFVAQPPALELPAINSNNARIVLVGSDPEMLGHITNILPPGSATTRFDEPYQALAGLTDDPQDMLVVAPGTGDLEDYLELFRGIRGNSRLYNLPVVMVSDGKLADLDPPYTAGATAVFQWPDEMGLIRTQTDLLVLQDRYRMAMRSAYRQTHMGRTRDELTGLYTHGFLHEHLGAQIAAAQAGRKYLTLGYFEIASLTKLNTAYGYAAGDHLLRQVGGIITSLVRAEDVPGRYHGGSLCVIMSETPKGEGQAALNRIGGVISNTEFAVMDVPEPVAVDFRNGSAELRDGDTPESLIQRAREDMG